MKAAPGRTVTLTVNGASRTATVEARRSLADFLRHDGRLIPLQQAFWENQGLQCGFCTPGMLIVSHRLLQQNPSPSAQDVREAISGNICRCTGYQDIVTSVLAAKRRSASSAPASACSTMESSLRREPWTRSG